MIDIAKERKSTFSWKGDRLYHGRRFTGVSIVQDAQYPQMWRVKYKDTLSDMVNRTRAKDAAISILRSYSDDAGNAVRRPVEAISGSEAPREP